MADYFSPTVIQPSIPVADITPLERLLLDHIFSVEPDGDALSLYAEEGPADFLIVDRAELEAALAASRDVASTAAAVVTEQLARSNGDGAEIDLDLSGTSYEFFFQDIVRRSPTLRYITAIASFECSKMRPDGFGGMACLITADRIIGKSTSDLIEDFFAEAGLDS
jgi:hypothetical protein